MSTKHEVKKYKFTIVTPPPQTIYQIYQNTNSAKTANKSIAYGHVISAFEIEARQNGGRRFSCE